MSEPINEPMDIDIDMDINANNIIIPTFDYNSSPDKYVSLWKDFTSQLPNSNYIFEVTKCCNYSSIVVCSKKGNLLDLFNAVSSHFESPDIKQLFLLNNLTNEKLSIPVSSNILIRDFISKNKQNDYFRPVYPIPIPVVYRIYLDDGHTHTHTHTHTH